MSQLMSHIQKALQGMPKFKIMDICKPIHSNDIIIRIQDNNLYRYDFNKVIHAHLSKAFKLACKEYLMQGMLGNIPYMSLMTHLRIMPNINNINTPRLIGWGEVPSNEDRIRATPRLDLNTYPSRIKDITIGKLRELIEYELKYIRPLVHQVLLEDTSELGYMKIVPFHIQGIDVGIQVQGIINKNNDGHVCPFNTLFFTTAAIPTPVGTTEYNRLYNAILTILKKKYNLI